MFVIKKECSTLQEMDPVELERGQQQSEADIAAGRPVLYIQTRSRWGELLTYLMAERFQVTVEHISDMTTHQQNSYRAGYNFVTAQYIDRTFGAGACQSVEDAVDWFRYYHYRLHFHPEENNPLRDF